MATLLENQAGQVLRESNTLGGGGLAPSAASGDIRGFTNIAFPIVRRVFGGLVANELVSIQPMSLPSGLLFYLDYTYGTNVGGAESATSNTFSAGDSIYNNPAGKGVRSGSLGVGGQYDLVGTSYSRVHSSSNVAGVQGDADTIFRLGTGTTQVRADAGGSNTAGIGAQGVAGQNGRFLQFDPQITRLIEEEGGVFSFMTVDLSALGATCDLTAVKEIGLNTNQALTAELVAGAGNCELQEIPKTVQGGDGTFNVRRLNMLVTSASAGGAITPAPMATRSTTGAALLMVVSGASIDALDRTVGAAGAQISAFDVSWVKGAQLDSSDGSTLVVPQFESNFQVGVGQPLPEIPEIDIKIESVSVVAQTRKLRARWSPELAQDLNAYHSLDAEVELTQILSEQIALEIDREILNDLLVQADTNFFWDRRPGSFVNKRTGTAQARTSSLSTGPAFTGTVREWYETLVETIIDVANEIHRKTLRGSANFIVVSPDVATVLEASVLYKPNYSLDGDGQVSGMALGAESVGSLSNRFTVYKDPYFPRNKILVGFKGGSYLETGYVYAPYVPLIVTPTIFAPEDFTPRKGVMTRYGKKMVRNDFYGTVTCLGMDVI
jgi:hypothetical protein